MRIKSPYVGAVLVLLFALQASELTMPGVVTPAATIPLPLKGLPAIAATQGNAILALSDEVSTHLETCFERDAASSLIAINEYAPDGDFAIGVEDASLILALYRRHWGVVWDYADRCQTEDYYRHAKAVKKLRTASLSSDGTDRYKPGSSWGSSGPSSHFGSGGSKGAPGILNASLGPGGGFGGGGTGGGGGDTGGGDTGTDTGNDPSNHLTGPDSGGKGPGDDGSGGKGPGGDGPDDKGTGGDGPGNNDSGSPGGPGDITVVPEPGTLALFAGLLAGFGFMRRRVVSD